VATILYTALGTTVFPKERLELFADGNAVALDDYRRLTARGRERLDLKDRRGDKGHNAEMQHFTDAILGRARPEITYVEGIRATICCLKIFESVKTGEPVEIDPEEWL